MATIDPPLFHRQLDDVLEGCDVHLQAEENDGDLKDNHLSSRAVHLMVASLPCLQEEQTHHCVEGRLLKVLHGKHVELLPQRLAVLSQANYEGWWCMQYKSANHAFRRWVRCAANCEALSVTCRMIQSCSGLFNPIKVYKAAE